MSKIAKTLIFSVTMMLSVVFADAEQKPGQPVITKAYDAAPVENFNMRDATVYSFDEGCSDNNSGNSSAEQLSLAVTDAGTITSMLLTGFYTVSENYNNELVLYFGSETGGLLGFYIGSLQSWDNYEATFDLSAYYAGWELADTWYVLIQDYYDDGGGAGCNFSMSVEVAAPCTDTEVTFNLLDSYGDGWGTNSITFDDDVLTFSSGTDASFLYCLADGNYSYTFTAGSWSSECSWTVELSDGTVLSSGAGVEGDYTFTVGTPPTPPANLFFSEYAEGTSSNKYLEVYNGSGADVDLSSYLIMQNSNGGPWDEYVDT